MWLYLRIEELVLFLFFLALRMFFVIRRTELSRAGRSGLGIL